MEIQNTALSRRLGHRMTAGALAALATAAVLTPTAAHAATTQTAETAQAARTASAASTAPTSCKISIGTSAVMALRAGGLKPVSGSQWTKLADSCHDFNLIAVNARDTYSGWLENTSTGEWHECVLHNVPDWPGHGPIVLCSNVLPGTPMVVTTGDAKPHTVTVEY